MMKTIRKNQFETNSSSVHTLAYRNVKWADPDLPINPATNKVIGRLGHFGKDFNYYETQRDKLSYLLTVMWCFCGENFDKTEHCWYFGELTDVIKKHCDCDGLEIDRDSDGSIDHQSFPEYYGSCELFELTEYNMEHFIFNDNIMLHTTCD